MSNSYQQSSFAIPVKDLELTRRRMQALDQFYKDETPFPKDLFGEAAVAHLAAITNEIGGRCFDWELFEDSVSPWLALRHSDTIDMEQAVAVAQLILWLEQDARVYTAEWADTCSRARLNEFGGGAVAFTREQSEWLGTAQLAQQLASKLKV